jgi:hypothetical protein
LANRVYLVVQAAAGQQTTQLAAQALQDKDLLGVMEQLQQPDTQQAAAVELLVQAVTQQATLWQETAAQDRVHQ